MENNEVIKNENVMIDNNNENVMIENNDVYCNVCGYCESELDNAIVLCDGCDVSVHQACYGVSNIPENQWYCDPCQKAVNQNLIPSFNKLPSCQLCPALGGALKNVKDGGWCHVTCALWIPGLHFGNLDTRTDIYGLNKIDKRRFKFKCSICFMKRRNNDLKSVCVQCIVPSCRTAFHAQCGRVAGFELSFRQKKNSDDVEIVQFCDVHSSIKPSYKRIKYASKQVEKEKQYVKKYLSTDDLCNECNKSGELIFCDECDSSYHLKCIIEESLPEIGWICKRCELKNKTNPLQLQQRTYRDRISRLTIKDAVKWKKVKQNRFIDATDINIDSHSDLCYICCSVGQLLCCDKCPAAVHLNCSNLLTKPKGEWLCDVCNGKKPSKIFCYTLETYYQQKHNALLQSSLHLGDHTERCFACRGGGELICCDTCPLAFHISQRCSLLEETPNGYWECPICTGKRSHDDYRNIRLNSVLGAKYHHEHIEEQINQNEYIYGGILPDFGYKKCAFCQEYEYDKNINEYKWITEPNKQIDQMFVGPFFDYRRFKYYWTHRQCAVWAPLVYIRNHGEYYGVIEEIYRGENLRCVECRKKGAVLGCRVEDCRRTYHLECARKSFCHFFEKEYWILCPEHSLPNQFETFENNGYQFGDGYQFAFKPQVLRSSISALKMCIDSQEKNKNHKRRREIINKEYLNFCLRRPYDNSSNIYKKYSVKLHKDLLLSDKKSSRSNIKKKRKLYETHQTALKTLNSRQPELISNNELNWKNIGGLKKHIHDLKECVLVPLLYPELLNYCKIDAPSGIILHGPPGTGKTLLARTLSTYLHVNVNGVDRPIAFFSRKGADVLSKFHGETEQTVRAIFELARQNAPSIIFFDEIDALAPVRSPRQNQVHSSIVATLLSEMDGLQRNDQIFVLAATNRLSAIDPALRRPGRFDRELYVPLPNRQSREEIININCIKFTPSLDLNLIKQVADLTTGFSGADLKALCTEALLIAVSRCIPTIVNHTQHSKSDSKLLQQFMNGKLKEMDSLCLNDFLRALEKVRPRSSQHSINFQISKSLEQRIFENENTKSVLNQYINDASKIFKTNFLQLNRLLICGDHQHHFQDYVFKKLLQNIDLESSLQQIDLPSLLVENPESKCCEIFRDALLSPSILYLPHFNDYWMKMPTSLKNIFVQCFEELICRNPIPNVCIIATFTVKWNALNLYKLNLPSNLQEFFSTSYINIDILN